MPVYSRELYRTTDFEGEFFAYASRMDRDLLRRKLNRGFGPVNSIRANGAIRKLGNGRKSPRTCPAIRHVLVDSPHRHCHLSRIRNLFAFLRNRAEFAGIRFNR